MGTEKEHLDAKNLVGSTPLPTRKGQQAPSSNCTICLVFNFGSILKQSLGAKWFCVPLKLQAELF
jgi:hypothetical protein